MYTLQLFSLLLLGSIAFSQTIDYFPKPFTGDMTAIGGAGYAIVEGVNALQLNPAGLNNNNNSNEMLLNIEAKYYSYHLLNYLHSRKTGRTFYHDKIKPIYPQLSTKFQLSKRIAIGLGLTKFLTPYINNSRKAVTWSPLFTQVTKGNIYSITLGIGSVINDRINVGMNISNNWGKVISSIEGDNHYTDLGKTLKINKHLTGIGSSAGAQIHFENFNLGINITLPIKLNADVKYSISSDSLFKALIPTEKNQSIEYPANFGVGVSTIICNNWNFLFDLKTYILSDSDFSYNIYDYGDNYKWQDGVGFNIGLIYSPGTNSQYKFGYTYIPQVRSIYDISDSKDLFGIINTGQNVKHVFSVGSQINLPMIAIDYSLQYSLLNWHRDYMHDNWVIEDEYNEQEIGLSINIIYKSINKKGRV